MMRPAECPAEVAGATWPGSLTSRHGLGPPDVPAARSAARERKPALAGRWPLATVVGLIAAAHLPLLCTYALNLWSRPHYRFFPLVLVGAGILAAGRRGERPSQGPGRAGPYLLLAVPSLLLLGVAVLLCSPWLGALAAMAACAAAVYGMGGWALCLHLAPAWLLLWLAIRPPLNLDLDLITWLQGLTARWASGVLDLFGIVHVLAGNVVKLPSGQLFVEEACSGIHWLFSLLACTLFLVLWRRRPLLHAALLLAGAVAWVLVCNAARVVLVTVLSLRLGWPVTEGWPHQLLGLALFAVALTLVASTDRLLLFFAPAYPAGWSRRRRKPSISTRRTEPMPAAPVDRTGGRSGSAGQAEPHSISSPAAAQAVGDDTVRPPCPPAPAANTAQVSPARQRCDGEGTPPPAAATPGGRTRQVAAGGQRAQTPWPAALPVASCYALLLVLQLALAATDYADAAPGRPRRLSAAGPLTINRQLLPAAWHDWRLVDYQTNRRSADPTLAHFSHLWNYRAGTHTATLSFSYPFPTWHDVSKCYELQGWQVTVKGVRSTGGSGTQRTSGQGRFVELELRKDAISEYAWVMYGMFRPGQGPAEPPSSGLLGRALWRVHDGYRRRLAAARTPLFQVQLMLRSWSPFTDPESELLVHARQLFQLAWATLHEELKRPAAAVAP